MISKDPKPGQLRTLPKAEKTRPHVVPPEPVYKDPALVVKFTERRENAAGKSPFGRMR